MSLFYEIMQFLFAIGASNITDIVGNALGGIIGITIYCILCRLFKIDFKINNNNNIINIIALIGTICMVALLVLLVIVNT